MLNIIDHDVTNLQSIFRNNVIKKFTARGILNVKKQTVILNTKELRFH